MAPPSEFDLRAALREGEGDKPNINRVMIAVDARRQRRVRMASAAVIVAVAGGLGVSAAVLGGGTESSGSSATAAGGALNNAGGAAAPAASAPRAAKDRLAQVPCPSTAPDYAAAQTSQGRGAAHASAPLFDGRVSSVVVCAYGPTVHAASSPLRTPARLELAGRQAKRVATSLENAPTAAPNGSCSSYAILQYAVIPVKPSGKQGRPVIAQLPSSPCGALVTNGTAIRYDWQPPPGVAAQLDRLSPSLPPDSPAPAASPTSSPTG